MKTLLLASALLAGLLFAGPLAAAPAPGPAPGPDPALYRPFCTVLWLFGRSCAEVGTTIVKQIEALSPPVGCKLCQYNLVSFTPTAIKATHSSIDGLQAEDMILTLSPIAMASACRVTAKSTSLTYTSLLDGGVNYCNLHRVLSATGLTNSSDFKEMTNEWSCISYKLSNC